MNEVSVSVENANTKLYTSFWRTSRTIPKWLSKIFSQHVIQGETSVHNFDSESEQQSMQWNEKLVNNCHFVTLRNSLFSMSNANNQGLLKCTKYL